MALVGYRDAAVAPHREGLDLLELARSLALAADGTHKLAIGPDDNDAIVQNIQHDQVAGPVEARAQGRPEEGPLLPRVRAACAVDLGQLQGQRLVLRDGRDGEQDGCDLAGNSFHRTSSRCGTAGQKSILVQKRAYHTITTGMIHAIQNRSQPGFFAVRIKAHARKRSRRRYRTRMYFRSMRGPTSAP